MIGSIIVVGFFILGCLLGWAGLLPNWIMDADLSMYVLYALSLIHISEPTRPY
mgnify:CR=1 FL=1